MEEQATMQLDMAVGERAYAESLSSLLAKIHENLTEAGKGKVAVKPGEAAAYLEGVTREVSKGMEAAVAGMDIRECAVIFGTVLGSELGVYLGKGQLEEARIVEIAEAVVFAMQDTARRIAKQIG